MKSSRYTPNLKEYIGQCELNYIRLKQLLPLLKEQDERVFGVCQGDSDESKRVRCQVIERSPYTTTVTLTQESNLTDWMPEPSIKVRLYHDARMAEVLAFQKNHYIQSSYSYPNNKMYHRDEKEQHNQFLGEWLKFCLAHGFDEVDIDGLFAFSSSS